jgi:hypothetical protein
MCQHSALDPLVLPQRDSETFADRQERALPLLRAPDTALTDVA